jgi:hypothetical protein
MLAAFRQHVADVIDGVTANQMAGANQAAFGQDQLIRGVQTFRDPATGGTMELSNQYDHAWLNGANEYVMSDNPNFQFQRQSHRKLDPIRGGATATLRKGGAG